MIAKTEVTDMDSAMLRQRERRHATYDAALSGFGGGGRGGAHGGVGEAVRRPPAGRAQRAPLLAGIIAARIVPRLILAHRPEGAAGPRAASDGAGISPEDVLMLGELVLHGDIRPALAYVESVLARGVPPETVYVDLLAPAARRLGELWCEDTLSFAEVTIGQVALQRLQRAFSGIFLRDCPSPNPRRRVLLSPLPDEQHAFGHVMVCDFFRRAGWQVSGDPFASQPAMVAAVAESRFDVVGISLSCAGRMRELGALIRALRRASRNPALAVLVGGAPFCNRPALAWQVGADASAVDACHAPSRAEALVGLLRAAP